MDHGACNVIYLDRRAREELVRKEFPGPHPDVSDNATGKDSLNYFKTDVSAHDEVNNNIRHILSTFSQGESQYPIALVIACIGRCRLWFEFTNLTAIINSYGMPIWREMPVQTVRTA